MSLIKQIQQEEIEDAGHRAAREFINSTNVRAIVLIEGSERDLEQEPSGCFACDDGVQPGHFKCEQPNAYMLRAEKAGLVSRAYTDEQADGSRGSSSAWRWFVV